MSKFGRILTAVMSAAAIAASSVSMAVSVNAAEGEHLYKYSELKAMSESEMLDVYYGIEGIRPLALGFPQLTEEEEHDGTMHKCENLDQFCFEIAERVLSFNPYNPYNGQNLDLVLWNDKYNSASCQHPDFRYVPEETEKTVKEIFDYEGGYTFLTPEALKEAGAYDCYDCAVKFNDREFDLYNVDGFRLEEMIPDTKAAIAKDDNLKDYAAAYICLAQIGFDTENEYGMYGEGEKYATGCLAETEEEWEEFYKQFNRKEIRTYTLDELFKMSDEEFFSLQGKYCSGKDYYDSVYGFATRSSELDENKYSDMDGISGTLYKQVNDSHSEDAYQKGVTEEALKSLLGDTVKYGIGSPSFEDDMYYSFKLSVHFPDYVSYETMSGDDERIMGFAKCWYCIDQVLYFDYYANGMVGGDGGGVYTDISTLKGDVDLNMEVNLADLTTLAKYNLNNAVYSRANDTAYANADMNGDGGVDGLDTSVLIENQLGKK